MPKIAKEYREKGLCPKCNMPVEYTYILEGPLEDDRELARITVKMRCPFCGYTIEKKLIMPIKGLNYMKYILLPEVRPAVEKLYLLYKIRIPEDEGA